jgi:hypothetical protein
MSGKSVAQKLGLEPGKTFLVSNAPAPVNKLLGPTPDDAPVTETRCG